MENKKRLIDADALIKHLGEEPMVWCDGEAEIQERDDWRRFKAYIEAQDTIDAVLVVHGHWIVDRERMSAECSECGKGLNFSDEMQIDLLERMERYCYYCGAKMDGDENG